MSYILKYKLYTLQICHVYIQSKSHIWYMFQTNFFCVEQLYHISLKYNLYVVYVSKKKFFVLKNYVIYF